MEDWYRDALRAGVRDNLLRAHRCVDDLEMLHARVLRRAVALLTGSAGGGVPPPETRMAHHLSRQLAALRGALSEESANVSRRFRLLSPTEQQVACCDEETRHPLADLAARFARLTGGDIPDCLAALERLSNGLTVRAAQANNTEKEVCCDTTRTDG